ncbi:MAG: beta-phosphoglucomutase [Subdoligranulum sp.]|nr:beta-phosphoglucomutase [Subdoligranulum sp.]
MALKAVIFDLDGVICFTDEYHYLAWKAMADSIDVPFDRTINNRLRGVSRMASLEIILEKSETVFSDAEKAVLAQQKNELYKQYLLRITPDDLSKEVLDTLNVLRGNGLQLAIGSSSKNTPLILQQLGLSGFFDAVSDGNGITHSKPDPEVFGKAAGMLGLPPEVCLVVEDAVSGAEAGHRAGMRVACVGDAALAGAGDYNLDSIAELTGIVPGLM